MTKLRLHTSILMVAILLITLALSIGCDNEFEQLEPNEKAVVFEITATIPHNEQFNVPLSSGVIIHFSEDINAQTINDRVQLIDNTGETAEFTVDVVDGSIILKPVGLWKERTVYVLTVLPGITDAKGNMTLEHSRVISFETGVRRPKSEEVLSVMHVVPAENDYCWDFITFRVFFNEPVDRTSVAYGRSFFFTEADSGQEVTGNVFARGNQIVFDPDEDLTPGETYRMTISKELKDYNGDSLEEEFTREFVAEDTGKKTTIAMDKCPSVVEYDSFCETSDINDILPNSKFIDRELNTMFTDSVVLGPIDFKIGDRLWNEFSDPKLHPKRVPLVVRKGQKIVGKGIEGAVGGVIPTGTDTGTVTVTVMADTIGEMLGSEYVHGVPGLPATIKLTMDAAVSAEDNGGNGVLGQPILGATLIGQATVDKIDDIENYEAMEIEIVGFAEVEILNEWVPVTMSLRMVPPPVMPEERVPDTEGPVVRGVSPADWTSVQADLTDIVTVRQAGDEIIVGFSEAIDPDTVEDNIELIKNGSSKVAGKFEVYNPKVVFIPDRPLDPDTTYTVRVKSGITDVVGNPMEGDYSTSYKTMPPQSSPVDPPLLNATVPGNYEGATLPANFYVELYFSQIIEQDSLVYGDPDASEFSEQGNIAIFDVSDGGKLVPATPTYYSLFTQIVPDRHLIKGHKYRLVVTDGITNIDGLALDTDTDRTEGGPNREVTFTVTGITKDVQSMLATYPYADADGSGYLDGTEKDIPTNSMTMDFALVHEPTYTQGFFPITVSSLIYDSDGDPRMPIYVEPSAKTFASSVRMSLSGTDKAEAPSLLEMGRITIDIQPNSSTDLVPGADGLAGVDVHTEMLFSVENQLMNNFIIHDTALDILSKLVISDDGRMVVIVNGMSAMRMNIPIVGLVEVPIDVKLLTSTIPSRRGF